MAQDTATLGSTLAGTDQTLQKTAQSAATFPTEAKQGEATLAQTQQNVAQDAARFPTQQAQDAATLEATQTGTAATQQRTQYERLDRPTKLQNQALDIQAKEQDADNRRLTHKKIAFDMEKAIRQEAAGDVVTKDLLAQAAADPKSTSKGHAAKLASVGRYGEALEMAMPETGTKMVDYLMREEGMPFQQAMGEWKRWETKDIKPQTFGPGREAKSLSEFNKPYGDLSQPERQKLEQKIIQDEVRVRMAENPTLNEKTALIDTGVETAAKVLSGDALTLYAGPGRARAGKFWQWAGQKVPEDEATLHQNLALIRNAYILENSGAGTSIEEVGRNFDATFDLNQHPDVVKSKMRNWAEFQLRKRDNLVSGAVTQEPPVLPNAAPPAQAPAQQGQPPQQTQPIPEAQSIEDIRKFFPDFQ
jgi:hypothetical protein